jgi:EF-P beta-lysylation protein EpmB
MKTPPIWRKIQRNNFTSLASLIQFLAMDEDKVQSLCLDPSFPVNIPFRLASKIEKNNLTDPLLLQFLPRADEKKIVEGFDKNPLKDPSFQKGGKLLYKYKNRALLVCTQACAMHCRYCFRQNFDYAKEAGFEQELKIIRKDTSLAEIILSGGDPLSLSDAVIEHLLLDLATIPHLKRVRFHTRFPIGIPERIDEKFLHLLEKHPQQIIFVMHINHPKELDADVLLAIKNLQKLGIPVLNQSVLLKDVNDQPKTLLALSEILVNHGILPYYLHQLDRIEGASHFEVPQEKGHDLIRYLQTHTSGYAVPKYVQEIPGKTSKTALHPGESLESQNFESLLQNSGCKL